MPAVAAVFLTAVAILSGIVGLFLVLALGQTDGGLRLAGIGGVELVVARLPTLAVGVPVVGEISVAVALQFVAPVNPVALLAVTGLLGVTYGTIGILSGLLFDRLAGVYAMLFVPLVDILLSQNPLATALPDWATSLPGHHATAALFNAAFTVGVPRTAVLGAACYAAILLAVSVLMLSPAIRVR